ncbi:MAG: DUF502 domain-containing protein [Flavipsychrobacter sp.]|nr:DUF502 domain-containing protein [Flavipsychrobacter sp.]
MRRLAAILFRSFLQGLLIISPIAITAYVIYTVFDSVDSLLPVQQFPRGLGFITIIAIVTVVGYLGTRLFIGRMLFEGFNHLMEHTPGIKYIYSSIKDVLDSFVGDKKKFNKAVLLKTSNSPELWRVGFVTQDDLSEMNLPGMIAVYLPHSYAISGWVVVTEKQNIKPIENMTSAEAMKFAVSGGITSHVDDKN